MTTVLQAIVLVTAFAAIALHVAVVVQAFRRSLPWGFLALFVPFASVIFAFTLLEARRRLLWAGLLLGFVLAAVASSSLLAASYYAAHENTGEGMSQFESQKGSLDDIQDLQLPGKPDGKK